MLTEELRIVVCDPQRLVCEAAARLITDEFPHAWVGGCTDIAEVISLVQSSNARLLLLQVPDCDSAVIERLIAIIRRACPECRLLAIALSRNPEAVRTLLQVGIDGCLLTSEPKTVLFSAIRAMQRAEPFLSPAIRRIDRRAGYAGHSAHEWRGAVA
jgi:DNA-binding NarL/FixJ family response regulator